MNNLYDLFAAAAARFPERVAVELQGAHGVEPHRYTELEAMARGVAALLGEHGCARGDRVAILAQNDAHWCAAFWGILKLGAVAVPLDTAYSPHQIATVVADCGARVLLAGPRQLVTAREALASRGPDTETLALRQATEPSVAATHDLAEGATEHEDAAVILYTSGTTSDPKGVVLTHANLLAEREAAFCVVTVDERDVVLSVLPLFHALALLANLLLPLTAGARVVFLESVNTVELMRALRERDVTAFCCVPQFFYLLYERVAREVAASGVLRRTLFRTFLAANGGLRRALRFNLGKVLFRPVHRALGTRMRILVTGGSRFDPVIQKELGRLGFDIQQAYGLTECSGAATITHPGELPVGDVGPPLPGVEVRIAPRGDTDEEDDAAGSEVRDGEVLVRGPIVMQGYYNRPDANAATLQDGWLHTGDLGYVDAQGRLHITGRKKEVIVLASGKNIYPEEIESHYARSAFVKELCVLGRSRPSDPSAERLHAVIVPDLDVMRERKIVNMGEQIRFEIEGLSVQLPSHKRIMTYEIRLEDLPRTTTRKLRRFEVERQLRAAGKEAAAIPSSAAGADDPEWLAESLAARVVELMRGFVKSGTVVTPGANLELDLGLDSMERVELLVHLEQALGVRVPEEAAHRIYTVRDLVDGLRQAPQGEAGRAAPAWDRVLEEAPDDEPALAALLPRRPVSTALIYLVMRSFYLLARLSLGLRVSGAERLPASGPFILSPNHQSYLDAFLLVSALPYRVFRRTFFVGASEYFETPLRQRIARWIHVVPVDADKNLVRAMKAGAFGLRNDKALILFPEGERSIDGAVKTFKKGAAILALHLGVPIVPVAMDGVFEVWPRNRPLQWRKLLPGNGRVLIEIGEPIAPQADAAPAAPVETQYAALTARLRDAVEAGWALLRARRGLAAETPHD